MKLEFKKFESKSENTNKLSSLSVSDEVFRYPFNSALIHQVVSGYLINSRQGSKSQKNRSEVSGSNKKPWRQKGTGKARSGSVKSPIWRSGGVTFAAQPKKYNQKINKKMYRGALKSIISKLVSDNRLLLIENLLLSEPKTKLLLERLKQITTSKSILILIDSLDKNLLLASRNIHTIKVCEWLHMNPVSMINFEVILMTKASIMKVEKQLL